MEIVSSLHVLNVHIQFVHYTYKKKTNNKKKLCTVDRQPDIHAESKMSSESSAFQTAAFLFGFMSFILI